MLTLVAEQPESLWDVVLPVEARELPEDLGRLDVLFGRRGVVVADRGAQWRSEFQRTGRLVLSDGRPTIAMESFVRLMVLKARYGWGYRTLVSEVSDSLHLRRFCRIGLSGRVPDESTVRKLTRRIGPEMVNEITRALISKACREKRFRARAVRIDSTVIEADVRYPTDASLAGHGVRALARTARKTMLLVKEKIGVRDRSRVLGRTLRAISRTIRRRTGEAKSEVLGLTAKTGRLLEDSIKETRRLAARARERSRGRGARGKLATVRRLEELADRCEKVARQIKQRVAGKPITDRLVSLSDPDARPIRKGKLGKPNEFGYVAQICEVTENTKRGARGLILPAASAPGNPGENTLLPTTVAEFTRLGISPREVALDGGFQSGPTNKALAEIAPERVFISGRQQPGSKRTQRRLQRYRTGAEGRISHLKRGYGLRRSRLRGQQGQRTWTGWSILAYNLDTLAIRTG